VAKNGSTDFLIATVKLCLQTAWYRCSLRNTCIYSGSHLCQERFGFV